MVVVCSESYISIRKGAITGIARNYKQRKGVWYTLSKTTCDALNLFEGTEEYLLGKVGIAMSKENVDKKMSKAEKATI